ncbi:hypothetical protein DPEC_G00255100 [Dallia pectoralis]|uniref:Uncharacterized protein n=1 Tax=Dallia pectoralis TaxID=75939 RepID=A0ACC2FU68_DALPE|nr:hypothetical protein DPEC_G00255100 [Dallia pectoralis]
MLRRRSDDDSVAEAEIGLTCDSLTQYQHQIRSYRDRLYHKSSSSRAIAERIEKRISTRDRKSRSMILTPKEDFGFESLYVRFQNDLDLTKPIIHTTKAEFSWAADEPSELWERVQIPRF